MTYFYLNPNDNTTLYWLGWVWSEEYECWLVKPLTRLHKHKYLEYAYTTGYVTEWLEILLMKQNGSKNPKYYTENLLLTAKMYSVD